MEIITTHKAAEIFPIQEMSQISDIRRYVSYLAGELNFTEIEIANVAIVVTEMGTNLIKHTSTGGDIIVQAVTDNQYTRIELLALDKGPGIAKLGLCLQDGYSTTQTQGTGFGAMQRLSDEFDIYTQLDQGTVVLAGFWHHFTEKAPASCSVNTGLCVGSLCLPIAGESVCGDGWIIITNKRQDIHTVLLSDGLGHGLGAFEASQIALSIFRTHPDKDIPSLFDLLNKALHKTRGAAIAIAQINCALSTLTFGGIGNVEGKLLTSAKNYTLLSQNGIVGHEYRRIQKLSYVFEGKMNFILHSDGLKNRWDLSHYPGLLAKRPSLISAVLYRDYQRGRDDASIVILKF